MSAHSSVSGFLHKQIEQGALRADTDQMEAATSIDRLLGELETYKPKRSLFGKPKPVPKGLYLWGDVGRGKSMLMDVFFEHVPTAKKRRVHFHAFMQDVHAVINAWRKLPEKEQKKHPHYVRNAGEDPIAPTAKSMALGAHIVCFDEFHITDIADAMILSRLFTALFARGVVVVATSNRAPDDLYKDGLNRQLFLPFIELLKANLEIFAFGGDTDHRLRKLQGAGVYFSPLGETSDQALETAWERLIRPAKAKTATLNVQGRKLEILSASMTARSSFDALCAQALGPADYLAIAQHFSALVLENIPVLGPENRNEAKRFVTLIDTLYESKTKLIVSAAAPPDRLYQKGDGAFEFARTVSRLVEMQSEAYLKAAHRMGEPE